MKTMVEVDTEDYAKDIVDVEDVAIFNGEILADSIDTLYYQRRCGFN